jgi:hypothetical protein
MYTLTACKTNPEGGPPVQTVHPPVSHYTVTPLVEYRDPDNDASPWRITAIEIEFSEGRTAVRIYLPHDAEVVYATAINSGRTIGTYKWDQDKCDFWSDGTPASDLPPKDEQ